MQSKKIIPDIFKTYCTVKENGRANELENGLRITLNKLANRIDRGYNVEIRVEPIKKSDSKRSIGTDISADLAEHIATISTAAKTLKFMKVTGPSVLSLPDEHFHRRKRETSDQE
jgi:hypothetical protein